MGKETGAFRAYRCLSGSRTNPAPNRTYRAPAFAPSERRIAQSAVTRPSFESCRARHFTPERAALAVREMPPRQNASRTVAVTTGIRYHAYVQYEWDNGKAAENLR